MKLGVFLIALFMPISAFAVCASNEIDVLGDGSQCETAKFIVTTTNMPANSTFKYWQGSRGVFYVDWGDGAVQVVTNPTLVSHIYGTAGVHTIRFGGLATEHDKNFAFNGDRVFGSVVFGDFINLTNGQKDSAHSGTPEFVAGISGSLGAIYPSLSVSLGNKSQPVFASTFEGCTNLIGEIPVSLFSGVTGGAAINGCNNTNKTMFFRTFYGCTNLGRDAVNGIPTYGIPAGLFGNLNNAVPSISMFQSTFEGCSGLTGVIPATLFNGVVGSPTAGLFNSTFRNCVGLNGEISSYLFENITGDASSVQLNCLDTNGYKITGDNTLYTTGAVSAFGGTFDGCTGLSGEIPGNLFSGITGSAPYLFNGTFRVCTGLSGEIPGNLFSGITGSASSLFKATFYKCSGLSGEIPGNLFSGITGSASNLFDNTFSRCTNLSGQIPENLFSGITGSASSLFLLTFNECSGLSGEIPENLFGRVVNGTFSGVTGSASNLFQGTFYGCSGLSGEIPENLFGRVVNGTFSGVTGSAPYLFNATFYNCSGLSGEIPENLFGRKVGGTYYGVNGGKAQMFRTTFYGACGLQSSVPSKLFAGVSGTADMLFNGTFNMQNCGENGLPESELTGYVDSELFAGVTGYSNNIFLDTFKNTQMDTTCPCGTHSATTAWGITSVDSRAVCESGVKTLSRDGVNEYYYDGDQSKCVTGCGYSLNLKQSGVENPLSYSLVTEQVVNPSMVVQIGEDICYLPFSQNSGSSSVAGELNMKMGNDYYHPGEMVTD